MTVYEKYAIEKDEDYLLNNLANINESLKIKDKNLFLENISSFYQNNYKFYKDKSFLKSKIEKTIKNDSSEKLNEFQNNDININESLIKTRSFSFHSIQNMEINFNNFGKKFDILTNTDSQCSTLCSNYFIKSPLEFLINDPILSQNIMKSQSTLKILIIGEEKIGKTFFVNKFLKKEINNCNDYLHTDALDINKNFIYLVNKSVKLEIYDTNN